MRIRYKSQVNADKQISRFLGADPVCQRLHADAIQVWAPNLCPALEVKGRERPSDNVLIP